MCDERPMRASVFDSGNSRDISPCSRYRVSPSNFGVLGRATCAIQRQNLEASDTRRLYGDDRWKAVAFNKWSLTGPVKEQRLDPQSPSHPPQGRSWRGNVPARLAGSSLGSLEIGGLEARDIRVASCHSRNFGTHFRILLVPGT